MASNSRSGRRSRTLAAGLGLGVASTGFLVSLSAPAHAATPVDIQLLNINDFHGRIDNNTTKFATTIEQLRAAGGEANTLFLSAGDNIGASLFASSVQNDQPTIDVLNALDLAASAVGNHEFDQGFDDLTGRVAAAADWSYLGANVYEAGTSTPALDEYAIFEVAGVTVGVIGAVTEETPSLVSPAGIENVDFGDPVEAVNRVAAELSDGDQSNGEAEVIVAEYHEGAGAGTPDGATLEQEVAGGGAFADIVTETSAQVDAIFTGHTHKQYAWDAPVPGQAGETRPIVQTGSYGENIGQIVLTVDPDTGEVSSYAAANVKRAATEDTSFERVAEVKEITDAALAYAAEVGNEPVATITEDITTAFSGGDYVNGEYTGGKRDDRASESTLGDLVANALRDGVEEFASPDLGLTNPGGLRADLLYAGDTDSNPENTDGVVTFAEANAVLPFNNTVAIVELTGAQLEQVLEQQWQTNPDGTVPSRPYLQLGLSDNVRVTADPDAPAGERITSVWIDDELLDPDMTYTVSTLSFLATGGDNFRAFTQGTFTDTGLLDAELWRDYLAANSPIAPDFARQHVFEDGLPSALRAGRTTSFVLSNLDLTSLGSPANKTVRAVYGDETLGTFQVVRGVTTVTIALPEDASGGVVDVIAKPSGTTVSIPVAASTAKSPARIRLDRRPNGPILQRETPVRMHIKVRSSGEPAAGDVTVKVGRRVFESELSDRGRATVNLGTFRNRGEKTVKVFYAGNDTTKAARKTLTFKVRKR